jgi:DNA repair exonuclease SbcCD nuclease subunit
MARTRILAIGDLHIQPDTLAEVNVFLKQLDKWLTENPVDLIVILGDTLHTHETVYTECLNKMLEYIRLCERHAPTEVMVGNHDYINNQQFLTPAHPFSGWKKSHNIVDYVKVSAVRGKKIVLCPYVPDGRFHEALRTVGDEWKSAACIFAHQLFDGAKMGPIVSKGVEKWDEKSPMVISGHIHDKQLVQENLWYTGSSMQISFGEREDHTISLVYLPDEGIPLIEEVNIHPPTKKTVYFDIAKAKEMKLPEEENVRVKVTLSGDSEEFKTFKKTAEYKKLLEKGVKVVFKQKRNVAIPDLPTTSLKSFPDILFSLIEDNAEMVHMYNEMFGQPSTVEIVFDEPLGVDEPSGVEIVFE